MHQPARSVATTRASAPAVALPQLPRLVDVLAGLPDARWLDRLVRGRAWIALIALALIGLVFMQVSMLKMNAGIGQSVERSAALERQNADLRASVSQLSSEERIQRAALDMGLVMPPAGDIRYLQSRGAYGDAVKAARIMRAPTPGAEQTTAAAAAIGVDAAQQAQTPPPTEAAAAAHQEQIAPQPQTQTQPQTEAAAAPPAATAQPQAQPVQPAPQQSQPVEQQQAAAPSAQAQAGAAVAPAPGPGQ